MLVSKLIFYISLNFIICMLILLQYINWIKILCRICFLDIQKKLCIWFTQISNCDRRNNHCVLFVCFIRLNAARWCGVYSRVAFYQINTERYTFKIFWFRLDHWFIKITHYLGGRQNNEMFGAGVMGPEGTTRGVGDYKDVHQILHGDFKNERNCSLREPSQTVCTF